MAGRNSTSQNRCRGPQPHSAAPAPLYDRVEDLRGSCLRTPPTGAADRASARAALAHAEMHVTRCHTPLPAPRHPSDQVTADLLRRQNELLTDILGVLNAQLAVDLKQRSR